MINYISIKNFAIIEDTEVEFEDGLNIITGETGAGKSIVVEAVSLALGSRADTGSIRTGADKAVIRLQGDLDGEELVIMREVSRSGKNICRVNGEIVTLAQLNEVSSKLADIHGQYDNQYLLNVDNHIVLLDGYRRNAILPIKERLSLAFNKYTEAKHSLAKLISEERENSAKKDYLKFQLSEIDNARLSIGEEEVLAQRIPLLQNSERIYGGLERAYAEINEADHSAIDALSSAMRSLEGISAFSKDIAAVSEEITDMYYRLQDLCGQLRDSKESIVFSQEELDQAMSRQYQISQLMKKYGGSVQEILEFRDNVERQLSTIENFDGEKKRLEATLKEALRSVTEICGELTAARKESALELEQNISAQLADLNFASANFKIAVEPLDAPTANGMDSVELLISTNPGEPLKPLSKIASGGEMSRIMLAFKTVVSTYDGIPTLIFDEIDTGISGITASIVGKKLLQLASAKQIICITHLAQIAACGDSNYKIMKSVQGEKTFTTIDALSEEAKVEEIARLIGGASVSQITLASAKELISASR